MLRFDTLTLTARIRVNRGWTRTRKPCALISESEIFASAEESPFNWIQLIHFWLLANFCPPFNGFVVKKHYDNESQQWSGSLSFVPYDISRIYPNANALRTFCINSSAFSFSILSIRQNVWSLLAVAPHTYIYVDKTSGKKTSKEQWFM